MLRTMAAYMLIALLTVGAVSAADPTVAERVAKTRFASKVKVELNSGELLKGRMGRARANEFTLVEKGQTAATGRVILFSDIKSIKHDGLTRGQKWIIVGVVWVVVGIVGGAIT
jgi:hypothetical protein